jgi:hypothetical protein
MFSEQGFLFSSVRAAMGVEFLAGGIAVAGIAVVMVFHDALRVMRMKRAVVVAHRRVR